MPALVPPLAAIPSFLLAPRFAPPVACVAGMLGPLIGADLLHLREIERLQTGVVAIGPGLPASAFQCTILPESNSPAIEVSEMLSEPQVQTIEYPEWDPSYFGLQAYWGTTNHFLEYMGYGLYVGRKLNEER